MQLAPNNGIKLNINTAALGMSCILCPGFHSPCYLKNVLKQQLLHIMNTMLQLGSIHMPRRKKEFGRKYWAKI